ncbi:MAG: ribonuclease E/G [Alphaproteobacteria bacterium]|nr:ribonuclease E/G [Alphaproteobacteria bacterium]
MARRMLIDASHPEETRVAVVNGKRLEDFDYETSRKKQLKGNVYLAKVIRVEPSLQAAFVDYGGNRHGFLAFSEIHPDYYQIPVADREQLLAEEKAAAEDEDGENGETVETVGGDEVEEVERRRIKHYRHYKIQEVIKRRQIMLVQVVKEERGNKGAALTTYLSLAGRYCVLMPNTARGGGISRKIGSVQDRRRLKKILDEFKIPEGLAVIVRTAGAERTKAEIKRDYEYLVRLWDDIRTRTMESIAPTLVHEEANLIKRSIRDLYSKDIDEVFVEGEEGYRTAKDFMKAMVPSHSKRVQRYDDPVYPLFFRYQVENQIDAIHNPIVQLRSGGYLVINSTEALVAIDVNSGRATRERHIEETALKTNLEAAEEVARQLRLRDLAGLIVIDFIDMEVNRNNAAVERRFKEALKNERARIQIGHISAFGLLEMSRQRLRPSLLETSSEACPHCGGTGHVRSTESTALHVMRGIEEEGLRKRASEIAVFVPSTVALYVLNNKRTALAAIEETCDMRISIAADDTLIPPEYRIERIVAREGAEEEDRSEIEQIIGPEEQSEDGRRKRRTRRRRSDRRDDEAPRATETDEAQTEESETGTLPETEAEAEAEAGSETRAERPAEAGEDDRRKRRRRGKRGGRRRGRKTEEGEGTEAIAGAEGAPLTEEAAPELAREETSPEQESEEDAVSRTSEAAGEETAPPKRKRAPRRRKKPVDAASAETADAGMAETVIDTEAAAEATAPSVVAETSTEMPEAEAKEEVKKPARRSRRKPAAAKAEDEAAEVKKPLRKRAAKKPAAKEKAVEAETGDKIVAEPAVTASPDTERETQTEPVSEPAAIPVPVQQAEEARPEMAEATAEPEAEKPAAEEPVKEKPKRMGWWQRTLGG